jgi:glycine/D-amino acid oxidase-like deaminating enzyme
MTNTSWCSLGLGDRLRIAGTAELNGYDRDLNRVRCEAIVKRAEQLFPGAGDSSQAQFWTGLRPATPSNVPIIGPQQIAQPVSQHRARHAGLDARLRVGQEHRAHHQRSRSPRWTSRLWVFDGEAVASKRG